MLDADTGLMASVSSRGRAAGFLSREGNQTTARCSGGHIIYADDLKTLTDDSLTQLAALLEQGRSDHLVHLLTTMARLHRYSLCIIAQRPTATRVAGFHTWRTLGAIIHVRPTLSVVVAFPHLQFDRVSRRYERGAIILTSNQSLGAWGEVFGDPVIASAILDRLLHHSITVNIRGDSYRLKEKMKAGLLKSRAVAAAETE
jgi:IstB-like ATP binding protein